MHLQYSQLCFCKALDHSGLDDIRDAVLLKFDSVSYKDFDIMSFTFLDSVKLRNLPTVIDNTMKTIGNQQIGTMSQLQSSLPPNNIHIGGGEKEKWAKSHGR